MFVLYTITVLYLDVTLATVSLLFKYIHILPFEILDKNLIALCPIMFAIARAYSLMVITPLYCKIMILGWSEFFFCNIGVRSFEFGRIVFLDYFG